MSSIRQLEAREIIDSRGCPTLEVEVFLDKGLSACGMVPSGASTGRFEALELRDGDPNYFFGKGVLKAIENVNQLSKHLKNVDVRNQKLIDQIL
ncbi:MAG: phosphopyruvate hydratase, partial [Bdellovibrionales bacterium]